MSTEFGLLTPPENAKRVIDKEKGYNYLTWINDDDQEVIAGRVGKEKYGSWVTRPGYRLFIQDGEVGIKEKE